MSPAAAAMDTDKVKIYGARVRVDSMTKVRAASAGRRAVKTYRRTHFSWLWQPCHIGLQHAAHPRPGAAHLLSRPSCL
jgi:hypothetical protein